MASRGPQVIVIFGATGDLARRKLLPAVQGLASAGLISEFEVVGTSLEPLDEEAFRELARGACRQFARDPVDPAELEAFTRRLTYVHAGAGAGGLADAVARAKARLGGAAEVLHYLSVPPSSAR